MSIWPVKDDGGTRSWQTPRTSLEGTLKWCSHAPFALALHVCNADVHFALMTLMTLMALVALVVMMTLSSLHVWREQATTTNGINYSWGVVPSKLSPPQQCPCRPPCFCNMSLVE